MQKSFQSPTELVDEELSAVCFVRDYVEFHFDGPVLRAISNPLVMSGGAISRYPAPGSRDHLCELIGSTVKSILIRENDACEIVTSTGKIVIPLDPDSRRDPEAMHFVPGVNMPVSVW